MLHSTPAVLAHRIRAAQGQVDCDLQIRNVTYLDVFSCAWKTGDISVHGGTIVGVEPGLKAKRVIDGRGKWIVPGFIDAHVHVESSLLVPSHFQNLVLPRGTTTAVCDPHELANVRGPSGIQYFLDSSEKLEMDLWIMLSSCVPATHLETNGGGSILASDLRPLASHPRALGLAEMMNMPGVLNGDPEVLQKLNDFAHSHIDGHCPLLKGQALSAYAAAGITSCHESSELEEAREKLSKGMRVWIREGSVAKDLTTLAPLLNLATSTSLGFCTDDRNPLDILDEGHLDHLVRRSIHLGHTTPEVIFRSASWSVARHYGLDQGLWRTGAIAPGFAADLVLLNDLSSVAIDEVYKDGVSSREIEAKSNRVNSENSIQAHVPSVSELSAPTGQVHVIRVLEGKIITDRQVLAHDAPDVLKLTVLERYGKGQKPANAYVTGFGALRGAIASSVGHDSHNLIVVGSNAEDMRSALAALIQSGGGFAVVQSGKVIAQLALPFGGLMSESDPESLRQSLRKLKEASRSIGCALHEPFLQLAFLSLPVIPSLKLTDRGLVDVDLFKFIDVRAS